MKERARLEHNAKAKVARQKKAAEKKQTKAIELEAAREGGEPEDLYDEGIPNDAENDSESEDEGEGDDGSSSESVGDYEAKS